MKREKKVLGFLHSLQIQGAKGLVLCYAVCVILFLIFKLCVGLWIFCGFQSGKYTQQNLTLNDFEQYGAEQLDDMTMINVTDDAQLWFTGDIYNLYVDCSFSYDPGEFLVFYSKRTDGAFSAEQCVRGKRMGKYYVFEFPAGVKQIRMDTGIFPSITISFREILANRYTFNTVMRFSTEELFYLLTVPGLLYGILDLVLGLFLPQRSGREQIAAGAASISG